MKDASWKYFDLTIKFLWLFSIVFIIFQGYSTYFRLPERFATHFDKSWNPDGWSDKNSFFTFWYLSVFALNSMILFVPYLVKWVPASWINIPNREYWLSTDELKNDCIRRVRGMLFGLYFWVNLIFIFIYESIIQINIGGSFHFPFWILFVLSGIMLGFSLIYSNRAFKKPE